MATEANLIIYTSASVDSLLAAAAHIQYCNNGGHSYTLKDVAAVVTGDIDTWIGTLSATTYDNIYIDCPCDGAAATASISTTQQYDLYAKLKTASKGTLGDEVSNATTATASTIGDSGETYVANAWANKWVYLTGGTGSGQLATVKSNSTTVFTIWGTFATTPDTSTDYKTLTGMKMHMCGTAHTTTARTSIKNITELAWDAVYPNNTIPLILSYRAGTPGYSVISGTTSSIAAGSATDSGASFATNAYAGMYVVEYDASTYPYQYTKIASNTGTALTGTLVDTTHYWHRKNTPTGTPTYKIVNSLSDVLNDKYIKYYVLTYLTDLTDSTVLAEYKRMIDTNGSLNEMPAGRGPVQDVAYIQGTVLPTGKILMDALYAAISF